MTTICQKLKNETDWSLFSNGETEARTAKQRPPGESVKAAGSQRRNGGRREITEDIQISRGFLKRQCVAVPTLTSAYRHAPGKEGRRASWLTVLERS